MQADLVLAPAPTSAGTARALVERTLSGWGCGELVDDARIVITELVSNAVRHARTEMRVALELRSDAIRVAVTDAGGGEVVVRDPDPQTDVGGRGLQIVRQLSDRWGAEPAERAMGKTVWAEWRLPR